MKLDEFKNKLAGLSEYVLNKISEDIIDYRLLEKANEERIHTEKKDIDGAKFGTYRPYTIMMKKAFRTYEGDEVNWHDTGAFLDGLKAVSIDKHTLQITSTDPKWQNGTIQRQKYLKTDKILGLSQADTNKITNSLTSEYSEGYLIDDIVAYFTGKYTNINKEFQKGLRKAGFKGQISTSETNFGISHYFYVNDKKVRVSDHSVGNISRMQNEVHFKIGEYHKAIDYYKKNKGLGE